MGSDSMTFGHAIEAAPQWLVTMINLSGALTIALMWM